MSVDHRRAGLRARGDCEVQKITCPCQSITGALACAPQKPSDLALCRVVSVDHRRAGLRAFWCQPEAPFTARVSRSQARWPARDEYLLGMIKDAACQSITGALACALFSMVYKC